MTTQKTKWLMTTTLAAAAFAFAGPAAADTVQVPGTIVVADHHEDGESSSMESDEVAPETATDDTPANTMSEPEGRMDDSEMEGGQVAPETSTDDTPAQASDPDAVEEEDSSMDNEEVGDPSTDPVGQ